MCVNYPSRWAEYCNQHICISVCLFVCLTSHMSQEPHVAKLSFHVVCGHGSGFVWWLCSTLCVFPCLWLTLFFHLVECGPESQTARMFHWVCHGHFQADVRQVVWSSLPGCRHWNRSLPSPTASCLILRSLTMQPDMSAWLCGTAVERRSLTGELSFPVLDLKLMGDPLCG